MGPLAEGDEEASLDTMSMDSSEASQPLGSTGSNGKRSRNPSVASGGLGISGTLSVITLSMSSDDGLETEDPEKALYDPVGCPHLAETFRAYNLGIGRAKVSDDELETVVGGGGSAAGVATFLLNGEETETSVQDDDMYQDSGKSGGRRSRTSGDSSDSTSDTSSSGSDSDTSDSDDVAFGNMDFGATLIVKDGSEDGTAADDNVGGTAELPGAAENAKAVAPVHRPRLHDNQNDTNTTEEKQSPSIVKDGHPLARRPKRTLSFKHAMQKKGNGNTKIRAKKSAKAGGNRLHLQQPTELSGAKQTVVANRNDRVGGSENDESTSNMASRPARGRVKRRAKVVGKSKIKAKSRKKKKGGKIRARTKGRNSRAEGAGTDTTESASVSASTNTDEIDSSADSQEIVSDLDLNFDIVGLDEATGADSTTAKQPTANDSAVVNGETKKSTSPSAVDMGQGQSHGNSVDGGLLTTKTAVLQPRPVLPPKRETKIASPPKRCVNDFICVRRIRNRARRGFIGMFVFLSTGELNPSLEQTVKNR